MVRQQPSTQRLNFFFNSYKITTFENKTRNNLENYKSSGKTAERLLTLLKMRGPLPAAVLAGELGITGEGARLHLLKLAEEGLVHAESITKGVGRPVQIWSLTAVGHARFPDAHVELTLQLLQTIENVLGKDALAEVVTAREKNQLEKYSKALDGVTGVENRIATFAAIRTSEGYLAEWHREGEGWLFIENHCPICAAATQCENICKSEMKTFHRILGNEVTVHRMDHIIAGSRRCVYKIELIPATVS